MTRLSLARCCAAFVALALSLPSVFAQTVLFSESFDTAETIFSANANDTVPLTLNAGWTYVNNEANQSDARFGFDYSSIAATDGSSTLLIPEAPNSQPGDAPQTGISLRTNVSQGAADQVGVYYEDASFTGQYQVQVDMFLSWAADDDQIGTTEHGGLFIGKDTLDNPASPDFPASTGAGAIFSSDGDTANFDHTILKNNIYPSTDSGQFTVTDFGFGTQLGYDNTDVNTNPANGDLIDLPALYPAKTLPSGITQSAGVVGYQWVTLTADVDTEALGNGTGTETGLTTFSVEIADTGESYTLGTLDNSVIDDVNDGPLTGFDIETEQGPVDMSGRVTLTIIDFFTSVASDINLATVIFDNLVVTAIDPGLDGDYNGDGSVDAADYTVYRDTLGDSVTAGSGADGNGNGFIDSGDYTVWANNYGAVAPPSTAIPEPTSVGLALIAAIAFASRRRG